MRAHLVRVASRLAQGNLARPARARRQCWARLGSREQPQERPTTYAAARGEALAVSLCDGAPLAPLSNEIPGWRGERAARSFLLPAFEVNNRDARFRQTGRLFFLARHILSLQDLSGVDQKKGEWALGNLIELFLLSLFPELQAAKVAAPADAEEAALRYARELITKAGPDSFEVYSTRRQILRYVEWYAEEAELGNALDLAKKICGLLPETTIDDWK